MGQTVTQGNAGQNQLGISMVFGPDKPGVDRTLPILGTAVQI